MHDDSAIVHTRSWGGEGPVASYRERASSHHRAELQSSRPRCKGLGSDEAAAEALASDGGFRVSQEAKGTSMHGRGDLGRLGRSVYAERYH